MDLCKKNAFVEATSTESGGIGSVAAVSGTNDKVQEDPSHQAAVSFEDAISEARSGPDGGGWAKDAIFDFVLSRYPNSKALPPNAQKLKNEAVLQLGNTAPVSIKTYQNVLKLCRKAKVAVTRK